MIARDIYAFYPLLIKYVDLQRNLWIRHNVAESEELYNHVGEVFNTMNISLVGMHKSDKSALGGIFRLLDLERVNTQPFRTLPSLDDMTGVC